MKKIFLTIVASVLVLSFASCAGDGNSEASSSAESVVSQTSGEVSEIFLSEAPIIDSDKIEQFPEEKKSHSTMDDENFYIKVQTISGEDVAIREFAQKNKNAYSSVAREDKFEWFYSDGSTTFSFDDENKVYEVYAFGALSINLGFNGTITEDGTCTFFEEKCKFVKYAIDERMSIIHFYRESDESWVGFQYVDDGKYGEVNIVLDSSDEYPENVKFAIPDDYEYYFEQGENVASIDWD